MLLGRLFDTDGRCGYKFLANDMWNIEFLHKFCNEHKQIYGYIPRIPRNPPSVVDLLSFNKKFVESINGEPIGPSGATHSDFLYWFQHGIWPWRSLRDLVAEHYRRQAKIHNKP